MSDDGKSEKSVTAVEETNVKIVIEKAPNPDDKKVFVSSLPDGWDADKVSDYFLHFAMVDDVYYNRVRYNAFVTFANQEIRDIVVGENHEVDGHWLHVTTPDKKGTPKGGGKFGAAKGASKGNDQDSKWGGSPTKADAGSDRGAGAASGNQLFVGGLPKQTATEDMVREAFEQFGEVTNVAMKKDEFGVCRGFCFVHFADASSVQLAMAEDAHMIDGKKVDVKPAAGGTAGGAKGGASKGGGKGEQSSGYGSYGAGGAGGGYSAGGKDSGKGGVGYSGGAGSYGKGGGGGDKWSAGGAGDSWDSKPAAASWSSDRSYGAAPSSKGSARSGPYDDYKPKSDYGDSKSNSWQDSSSKWGDDSSSKWQER